jgi:hypothetical protein
MPRARSHDQDRGKTPFTRRAALGGIMAGGLVMMQRTDAGAASSDRYVSPVEITADDIAWFRKCRSVWVESESGAPAAVPGGLSVLELSDAAETNRYRDVFERLERTLCAFFLHALFEKGRYPLAPLVPPEEAFADAPELAVIDVRPEHLLLFSQTNWRGPFIDGKRPYGNYTYYVAEMAKILSIPVPLNKDGRARLPAEMEAQLGALHHDMLFVLQAYLQHADLAPGRYLIPFDGWLTMILPRCQPVTQSQMDAYVSAMNPIIRQKFPDSPSNIVPRFKAAGLLFEF